ncbi:MAG: hypothetical protein AB2747_05315 [Candidatus Thiodiazotropha taylori]
MVVDTSSKALKQDFAKLIGVGPSAISSMIDRGVISDDQTMGEWIIAVMGHYREQAAGRKTSGDLVLADERARLAAEQADKVALQNKISRNEYAPVSVIEETLASVGRQIAGLLEALPVKLKRNTAMSNDQLAIVDEVIVETRNLAANVKPDWSQIDVPSTD